MTHMHMQPYLQPQDVLEELFDEVNVCHNHSSATVALASKLVHRITVTRVRRPSSVTERRALLTHQQHRHRSALSIAPTDLQQPV